MGLAHRIIPTLLKRGAHLVKGRQFSADRVVGHLLQAARIHQARGVDELVILDVAAKDGPDFDAIRQLTDSCFMPITVGGGVRGSEDVRKLLDAGADKISMKTLWSEDLNSFNAIAARYGRQAVVASLDCVSDCPVEYAAKWARLLEEAGAGEILLTAIGREGMMMGYDIELIEAVCDATDIPVVAHGGCAGPEDMLRAIEAGASAVAAGALFQFTEWTPRGCAEWLLEHGVEVRV